jgi:hypothetical protein
MSVWSAFGQLTNIANANSSTSLTAFDTWGRVTASTQQTIDIYRWNTDANALRFGKRPYATTVNFPSGSGGSCPAGWTRQ